MEEIKISANKAYSNGEYAKAIELYSMAIAATSESSTLSVLHANRSASYFCLKMYDEALRDANIVIELKPMWTKGFEMRGASFFAMKKYEDALKAFSAGLVFDVNNEHLLRGQEEVSVELQKLASQKRRLMEVTDDFDCMICMKLLYEPVTTSCGHSFCRSCLVRALDHNTACPLCRTVIYMAPDHSISVVLQNVIQKNFPSEYKERVKEMEEEKIQDLAAMPLFLLSTVAFPEQDFPLHIFEPRYRLMVRRCLSGSRRFGLVCCTTSNPNGESIGCMLEIKEHNLLPDGRSFIKTVGTSRFRVLDKWLQDGYICGKVQPVADDKNEATMQEAIQLAQQVQQKIRSFVVGDNTTPTSKNLAGLIGDMPEIENPERFSFWVASRLPLTTQQAVQLLQSTSTPERLSLELQLIHQVAAIDSGTSRTNCLLQ